MRNGMALIPVGSAQGVCPNPHPGDRSFGPAWHDASHSFAGAEMTRMKRHTLSRCSVAALLLIAISAHAAAPAKRVVLPDAVTPVHYRIAFTPDAQALIFKGSV